MDNLLHIVPSWLAGLEGQVRSTAGDLADASDFPDVSLSSSERVQDELDSFMGKWDNHRDQLIEGLDAVAQALLAIRESFEGTDAALADVLS